MKLSIRARLTFWYTAVLSLVLAASAATSYLIHARSRLARVDDELGRTGALVARTLGMELAEGGPGLELSEASRSVLEDIHIPGRSIAVFGADGALLAGRWEGLPQTAQGGLAASSTVATGDTTFRIHRSLVRQERVQFEVGVAESLAAVDRELAGLRRALLGSILVALLLAVGGGWWIAHAALRPVTEMAAQARRITDRTPGFRLVSPKARDELGVLAGAFNDLLVRLESALAQQRHFMADASHELRTPVSISRTAIEVTLSRHDRQEEEYRDSLRVVAEQMRRLSRVVDDMFLLARADAASLPLNRGHVYLDELVADCVKQARVLAAPKEVEVSWQGPSDLEASGDEQRLRQMLMNLLDNALRYTPAGGHVRVDLGVEAGAAALAVTDSGNGIPVEGRDRVFERFVRLDGSGRPSDGAGLGLPIARAIAEAHGGTLVLARSDSSGSTFLARLPLSPRPDHGVMLHSSGLV